MSGYHLNTCYDTTSNSNKHKPIANVYINMGYVNNYGKITAGTQLYICDIMVSFWFDFCFMALRHILGHFGRGQLT